MNDTEVDVALRKLLQVLRVESKRVGSVVVFQELPTGQEGWKK